MSKIRLKLEVEPVPISTWGISLSNRLPKEAWDVLRKKVYKAGGYRCQICGSTLPPMHCHEVWKFNNKEKVQYLARLECICKICHDVKHFGRSQEVYKKDYITVLVNHWCEVNNLIEKAFYVYLKQIFHTNTIRSKIYYTVKVEGRILT